MAMDTNPYAPPRSDVNAGTGPDGPASSPYWRAGAILVARHGATLPPRCVKCNADVQEHLKKSRFYWHHQAWFILVLLNVILYAVVSLFVRRHADVTFGLCAEHRRKRRRAILVGLSGIALCIALMFAAVALREPALVPIALLAILVFIVYSVAKARALLPVRIDKLGAQFKGCGEAFLASLPGS
jgi:hypothetical protein